MASRVKSFLGLGLALGLAVGAWGQDLRPLEFSRKRMSYPTITPIYADTIRIRNPNAIDLRCDSIELLLGGTQLYGIHTFSAGNPANLDRQFLGLHPRDQGTLPSDGRVVFRPPRAELLFPRRQDLVLMWTGYSPCICKRSAEESPADSLRFKLVLHVRSFKDTLDLTLDSRYTTGIVLPRRLQAAPGESGGGPFRNLLGRRMDPVATKRGRIQDRFSPNDREAAWQRED